MKGLPRVTCLECGLKFQPEARQYFREYCSLTVDALFLGMVVAHFETKLAIDEEELYWCSGRCLGLFIAAAAVAKKAELAR